MEGREGNPFTEKADYDSDEGEIVNVVKAHEGNVNVVNVVTVDHEKKLLATSGIDEYAVLWEPHKLAAVRMGTVAGNVERRVRAIEEMERYDVNYGVM